MIHIRKNNQNTEKNDFWIGFSDLMTGLMLVFIVISLVFIIKAKEDALEKTEKIEKLLNQAEEDRKKMEDIIAKAKADKDKLDEQRKNIIMILSDKLKSHNIKFEYNSIKGTVTIAQDILFTKRQSTLNKDGKNFIKIFANILDKNIFNDNKYKDLIKYIHIEGYTDKEGSLKYNFLLSFNRAWNVWLYMTNSNIGYKRVMQNKLNIVSRGEIDANQIKIDENDRKVVFRFEFYDTYNKIFEGLSK